MEMLTGTSGYSYKEWCGHFYPAKLPANAMLRYYAERLKTVEINNTFYRMPDEALLSRWSGEVPDGFSFTLKAPRRITHIKRLNDVGGDVAEFMRRAGTLGDKLGMVLFQLPPFQRKDLGRLLDLLAAVPVGRGAAVEFRHDSWQDDEVYAALRERSAALCVADTDKGETPFVATSGLGYLRLRRTNYEEDELKAWVDRIASQPLSRAHVYFKHEGEGLAARLALRFEELWRERGAA